MFNYIVSGNVEAWEAPAYKCNKDRFLESTVPEIKEQYKNLDEATIEKIKSFPTLFTYEYQHNKDARIGWITSIRLKSTSLVIEYEFEPTLPPVSNSELSKVRLLLDINGFEFNRTYWAIKDEDLLAVLSKQGIIEKDSIDAINTRKATVGITKHSINSNQIFIVHGHDEAVKVSTARFISELGFEPIILPRGITAAVPISSSLLARTGSA